MRSIRTSRYKFIWNLASPLAYPFASDLWSSATSQQVMRSHPARFGARPIDAFLHRPAFELYDLADDPDESVNLASDPACQDLLRSFQNELRQFQEKTQDPWLHKWIYE